MPFSGNTNIRRLPIHWLFPLRNLWNLIRNKETKEKSLQLQSVFPLVSCNFGGKSEQSKWQVRYGPWLLSRKLTFRHLAGLLTYFRSEAPSRRPCRQWQSVLFLKEDYSSGYCPGFSPDSLFTLPDYRFRHQRRNKDKKKIDFILRFLIFRGACVQFRPG